MTAKRSSHFYATMAIVGLTVGLSAAAYGVQQNFVHDWDMAFSRFGSGFQFNYWGSLLVSGGYIIVVGATLRQGEILFVLVSG